MRKKKNPKRISLIKLTSQSTNQPNCDPSTYHLAKLPPNSHLCNLLCNLSIEVSKKQTYELCCFIGPFIYFIYIYIYFFFFLPGFLPGESHGGLKKIGPDLVTKQHVYLSIYPHIHTIVIVIQSLKAGYIQL